MNGERLMTATDTPPRTAAPTTAPLQPIDLAEMGSVEGGCLLQLLAAAYYFYKNGFPPIS
jgi:hypothetical protein